MEQLKDANFDPEFYRLYEDEIVAKFNQEQGYKHFRKKEKLETNFRLQGSMKNYKKYWFGRLPWRFFNFSLASLFM